MRAYGRLPPPAVEAASTKARRSEDLSNPVQASVERREFYRTLSEVVKRLSTKGPGGDDPPYFGEVFLMRHDAGLTLKTMSEQFGMSISQVRRLIEQANQAVHNGMVERGFHGPPGT